MALRRIFKPGKKPNGHDIARKRKQWKPDNADAHQVLHHAIGFHDFLLRINKHRAGRSNGQPGKINDRMFDPLSLNDAHKGVR